MNIKKNEVENPMEYDSDPMKRDTDKDGISDSSEILGWDVVIYHEATFEVKDSYHVYSDPQKLNTDESDLNDWDESIYSADPNKLDTDGDGINDDVEVAYDSNPSALEGVPPVIDNLYVEIVPSIDSFGGIPFQWGWDLVLSIESTDPSGPYQVDIEINGYVYTIYLQEDAVYTESVTGTTTISIELTTAFPWATVGANSVITIYDVYGNKLQSFIVGGGLPQFAWDIVSAIFAGASPFDYSELIDPDRFSRHVLVVPIQYPNWIFSDIEYRLIRGIEEQVRLAKLAADWWITKTGSGRTFCITLHNSRQKNDGII